MTAQPKQTPSILPLTVEAATMIAVAGDKVVLSTDGGHRTTATLGIAHEARPGDRVVVVREPSGAFVIAVLGRVRPPSVPALQLDDGSRARQVGETLRLEGADGALIVEHRAGTTTVHGGRGVEILAEEGSIHLRARDEVTIDARTVRLESEQGRVRVDRDGVAMEGETITATAERAELAVDETRFTGRLAHFCIDRARAAFGVVETDAGRIVQRAEQVYRDVSELAQLRAGRIRQVAEGSLMMLSERTLLRAETAVDLKGDKINLG